MNTCDQHQRGGGVQRGGQLIVVMCGVVPGVDTTLAGVPAAFRRLGEVIE
ncbi:MAG TPA: hypothetical protein VH540_07390 [Ktedonobacterales bacterium]